jgi:hypothetical protein
MLTSFTQARTIRFEQLTLAGSKLAIEAERKPVPKGRLRIAQDVSPGSNSAT